MHTPKLILYLSIFSFYYATWSFGKNLLAWQILTCQYFPTLWFENIVGHLCTKIDWYLQAPGIWKAVLIMMLSPPCCTVGMVFFWWCACLFVYLRPLSIGNTIDTWSRTDDPRPSFSTCISESWTPVNPVASSPVTLLWTTFSRYQKTI